MLEPGELVTFSDVAEQIGRPGSAQAVANVLRGAPDLPWWRVLPSDGRVYRNLAPVQIPLLRAEGHHVDDERHVHPGPPPPAPGRSRRGHRTLPHTADVIVEAWAPDLAACCEEAVAGLASLFVEAAGAEEIGRRSLHLAPGRDDDVLLDVLDEAIFTLDTAEGVPLRAEIGVATDGGLDVELVLADPRTVTATGAVPKGVSRSELTVTRERGEVRCRFLVDV